MPSKDEKARRKEKVRALQDQQRQRIREGLPAPVLVLKKLFDYVDLRLSNNECDNSLRFTREFLRRNAIDESRVIVWLEEYDGHCDCEVLNNVESVVAEAVPGFDQMRDGTDVVN